MQTRCSAHTARESKPACPTCDRIQVENEIVTRVVDALLGAGYALGLDALDGAAMACSPIRDRDALLAVLGECDREIVHVVPGGGWVHLVYGNGEDVLVDYSLNLETVLEPVNAYVDSIAP